MFRSTLLFLLSSFALFGLTFGSKINCPVSFYERWTNGAKGKVDVEVNANSKKEKSTWPGWKLVLTFDKKIDVIDGFHGKNDKCDGKICSFVSDNWIAKQNKDFKLALGFVITHQPMRQKPKVIGAKIASTELDEKHRTYYDLCPKEEPIVIKPRKKNDYPKCDEKFFKITSRQHNKAGYNGKLFLIHPRTILNYRVEVKMSKPFNQMSVFNGKGHKCSGKKCTFRNHEWNAQLIQGKPKAFEFNINYPANKHTYLAQMKINGRIICRGRD